MTAKPAVFAAGCHSLALLTETLVIEKNLSRSEKADAVEVARLMFTKEIKNCRALTAHVNRLFLQVGQKIIYTNLSCQGELRNLFKLIIICIPPERE